MSFEELEAVTLRRLRVWSMPKAPATLLPRVMAAAYEPEVVVRPAFSGLRRTVQVLLVAAVALPLIAAGALLDETLVLQGRSIFSAVVVLWRLVIEPNGYMFAAVAAALGACSTLYFTAMMLLLRDWRPD